MMHGQQNIKFVSFYTLCPDVHIILKFKYLLVYVYQRHMIFCVCYLA
jgi:hypothetical protein